MGGGSAEMAGARKSVDLVGGGGDETVMDRRRVFGDGDDMLVIGPGRRGLVETKDYAFRGGGECGHERGGMRPLRIGSGCNADRMPAFAFG